ncbi:MAG: class I SAM-dependent methyltransferase [Acidimicrobiia bacterium]|nr:class I SAM-dependent methyltransferase [Acidimicrobiia bacterium]
MQTGDKRRYWDDRYRNSCLWGVEPNLFLVESVADLPPGDALDLGCGQGRNAVWLARQGHTVTAVDQSEVALEQARELATASGVELTTVCADAATWDAPEAAFDLVILTYVQTPPHERRMIHAQAVRALRAGGRLFLAAHHLRNLTDGVGGPPSPDVLFTEADLAADFATLHILRNEEVVRHVEREDLTGDAVDVVLIAEKPES